MGAAGQRRDTGDDVARDRQRTIGVADAQQAGHLGSGHQHPVDRTTGTLPVDGLQRREAGGAEEGQPGQIQHELLVPAHMVVDVGQQPRGIGRVDLADGRPRKWLVENSWGEAKGSKGTWTLYDRWFDEHVYTIIAHKRHIPAETLAIFDQEPEALPAWYPGAQGIPGK